MSSPYRQSNPPQIKKLQRRKAFLRGLYRRVILPAKVIGGLIVFGIVCLGFSASCLKDAVADSKATLKQKAEEQEVQTKNHFNDWQQSIDKKQSEVDRRIADVERKENDLKLRIQLFEDTLSMSPLLVKDRNNVAPLLEAIGRSKRKP